METKKYNYKQLLNGLYELFADYGNQEMEIPSDFKDFNDDVENLTEEEAKEIFEYNDGDVEGVIEYLIDCEAQKQLN